MKKTKETKRALASSLLAMFLCVAMLIGTTFAWFTDSASTNVNKIQAGTLDIQLLDAAGQSLEGKTLSWKKATGHETGAVLWEPGCTYELQPITIKNAGNLALKYKIVISGIQGDAKLNDAIEWTINDTNLSADHSLAPGGSNTLTIKGHMKEEAGNEYQGLSIDNISITVVATQDTVESDSNNNRYDENAVYPVAPVLSNITISGAITPSEAVTLGNVNDATAPTAAQISIPAGAVTENTNAVFSMNLTNCGPDSVTYEISLKKEGMEESVSLSAPAVVTTNIGADLKNVIVKHNGVDMTTSGFSTTNPVDGTYKYYSTSGKLIICTKTFSPFQINYEFNGVASVNGIAYSTIPSAIAAAQEGDTVVLMKDVSTTSAITIEKDIILDLNGKKLSNPAYMYPSQIIQVMDGSNVTIKNGTISAERSGIVLFDGANNVTLEKVNIEVGYIGVWSTSVNNTIVINESEIQSKYIGVYQNGSFGGNNITIKGTEITDSVGAGVYISNSINNDKQNLTIDGCTIAGPSALEIKHTNASITDSTLIGTATPTASGSNGNGSCTDGYALAVTTNGVNDKVTGNVTVSNCKFYSGAVAEGTPNGYVFVYEVAEGSSVTIDGRVVDNYNTYGGEVSEGGSED